MARTLDSVIETAISNASAIDYMGKAQVVVRTGNNEFDLLLPGNPGAHAQPSGKHVALVYFRSTTYAESLVEGKFGHVVIERLEAGLPVEKYHGEIRGGDHLSESMKTKLIVTDSQEYRQGKKLAMAVSVDF